ncbi:hypothetical protein GCM10017783_19200 [Deinococcus piscis]|uniref:Uncharacterized protein n=1 Tax=Deinococcus piscis TaxID=394230 RepID=A0ABQ3KE77_9DEIO|nr:hypothetical protein GCM10017783_19200 [Deinococcus piscis]
MVAGLVAVPDASPIAAALAVCAVEVAVVLTVVAVLVVVSVLCGAVQPASRRVRVKAGTQERIERRVVMIQGSFQRESE